MRKFPSIVLMFLTALAALGLPCRGEFPGWQSLRVIQQEGRPRIVRAADLDGDSREELVIVNYRSSRLDLYQWVEKEDRKKVDIASEERPNELPMAPELKHIEVQLEQLPHDVVVKDLNDDGTPELVILVSTPNRVLVYHRPEDSETWKEKFHVDLLRGDISARKRNLLVRDLGENQLQLLVSLENGIQQLELKPSGQAEWFTPRESRSRTNWWLADLDGDGFEDLVEQNRESSESIRWYQGSASKMLAPAAVLYDRSIGDVEIMQNGTRADLVFIDGSVRGLLRRYQIEAGTPNPFGERHPLALDNAPNTAWCGMWQNSDRALVVADRSGPRLLSYTLSKTGWLDERTYPGVSQVEALAAPPAEPETLLIWVDDAAELLKSKWEGDRLTYPKPMAMQEAKNNAEDRKILALGTVGSCTWWVQQVGNHLDLYRWKKDESEPQKLRFEDVGSRANKVLWIGGERLLVKETHARGLKLVKQEEENTVVTSPSHLSRASLDDYKLIAEGEEFQLGRFDEGVLQWVNEELQSYEQVMLPQGQQLADYVATDASTGWALQQGSKFLYRIQEDESGLTTAQERLSVAEGVAIAQDPVLGILLIDRSQVIHLSEGRPKQLALLDAVDERVGRAGGVREIKFHRLQTTDIDRDGYEDLVVFDDLNHRLTVLKANEDHLEVGLSWLVFDDKVYPYSDDQDSLVHEPRGVQALDMDGDGNQDLALLCHDRLLIYFAREE